MFIRTRFIFMLFETNFVFVICSYVQLSYLGIHQLECVFSLTSNSDWRIK